MNKTYTVTSLQMLPQVAKDILSVCKDERVFALDGKMGAGKTTLTKAFCEALGCEDNVCSPTFAIVNAYYSDKVGDVFHFDFYRLDNVREAEEIGAEEYLYSGSYCFMEWSERIKDLLPETYVRIEIDILGENERKISINL